MTSEASTTTGAAVDVGISAEVPPSSTAVADPLQARAKQQRQAEINRFNRLFVYLPIGLITGFLIFMFGLLVWATLFADGSTEQGQASGVADVFITMLCLLPMTLLCLVLPGAGGYALYWRRNKGSVARKHVSNLAGKAERGINTADQKLNETQPRIVDGTIKARQTIDRIIDTIYDMATKFVALLDSKINPPND